MFRGIVNDSDNNEDIDFSELDNRAFTLQSEINKIEPNRNPQLELDYLGINNDFELIFSFNTTWMDRSADIEEYLDKVQDEIENGMDVIVTEREFLGYTKNK